MRANSKRYGFLNKTLSTNPNEVFLQQQKLVSTKMSDLKKEELVWLKLYFGYLAVFSLALAKLAIGTEAIDIVPTYVGYFWIIYVSSFLILGMLTYLRYLYYLQKINLEKWENILKVSNFTKGERWLEYTAPYKGFLVNVALVLIPSFLFASILRIGIEKTQWLCIPDNCSSIFYSFPLSFWQSLLSYLILFDLIVFFDWVLFKISIQPKRKRNFQAD